VRHDATATAFRQIPRAENIPAGYSPGWHVARTLALAIVIGTLGGYLARSARLVDWLFVPGFLVVANLIEYAFHRGPMHHPRPPRILYHNHTLIHHRAFLHEHMQIDDFRELSLIMMPWYTMLLLFILASPIALAAAAVRGPGVAGIFFLMAASYFVLYETLHSLYHMPPAVLRRLHLGGRVFSALQAHHRRHHHLDRMTFVNFNVTFPLWDWLLRTKERDA
jgi:hypothetical protein